MEPTKKINKTAGIVIGALVIVAVILVTVISGKKSSEQAATVDQTSSDTTTAQTQTPSDTASGTSQVPPTDTTTPASGSAYKDGTYSATGSYMSPGGLDHVGVTLTLASDIITAITVTPEPGDKTSAHYQSLFVSGYKQYVLGKDISTVHLSKVSGSSLTPGGFDNALAQIEAQAKA